MMRLKLSLLLILLGSGFLLGQLQRPRASKQKPIKRSEQKNPSTDNQNISASQQSKRSAINSPMTQQSSTDEQRYNEEKGYRERQIRLGKILNWITGGSVVIASSALYVV